MHPLPLIESTFKLQLGEFSVSAGFPNPCEDFIQKPVSLDDILIRNPTSTFIFRVNGNSMQPLIAHDAFIVVDKSIRATNGKIVLATIDSEFVIKELEIDTINQRVLFKSVNPKYKTIAINIDENNTWESGIIWGVVVGALSKF